MQTADRPRFRHDLVAEPIEDGGSKFIDVMDPDRGVLFRFYEVEYSLACAMDGQRDVAGIARWAEEELGLKASQNEIKHVIATLGDLGYLEGAEGAVAAAPAAAAAASAPAATAPSRAPAAPAKPVARATPPGGLKKQPEQPVLNRWDAPTNMGDADDYLAPGVVAGGKAAAAPSGADVELGAPGARGVEVKEELPRGADVELGAPGARANAPRGAAAKGADIALGAPGRADVSVDLADHVDIGAADVKEAVRASQVMKAVDVPPELAAELEAKPAAKAQPAAKVEAQPAAKPVEAKPVEAKPVEKPAAKPVEKPAEKPARPASVAPTAPRQGVSPMLIGLLVLAILVAGGFAIYKLVIKKDSTTSSSKTPPPIQKPEPPPPPPPVESQKLATEQPAPEELKPADAHQIAWIAANDTVVKMGEPVAKYVGFKSFETDVKSAQTALDKATTDIATAEKERDAAQTAGNKAGVTAADKKLAAAQKAQSDNQKKLADKQSGLDKFLLKSPAAGKVTAVAKLNAKVTPTDVVATLQRDTILVATFKKADGATDNAPVLLAVKGGDQKLACNVVLSSGDGTKIACPAGAAPEGTEVTYAGLDASRPATPPGETPPGTDNGSAATPPAGDDTGSAADKGGDKADKADKGAEAVTPKTPARPVRRPIRAGGNKAAGSDKVGSAVGDAAGDKAAGGDKANGDTQPAPPPPAPAGSGAP